jgi:hypothetical protein
VPPDVTAEAAIPPVPYDIVHVYAQAVEMINTIDPLVINVKSFTSLKLPYTPVTKTSAFKCQFSGASK